MGSNITSNLSDAFDDFERQAVDGMHEELAQGLAAEARKAGLHSADAIELEIESDSDDPRFAIDGERVRHRANEVLAE